VLASAVAALVVLVTPVSRLGRDRSVVLGFQLDLVKP